MPTRPTILLVSNDRQFIGEMRLRCVRFGVRVMIAYDEFTALDRIKDAIPQVACIDMSLPNSGGMIIFEALQRQGRPAVDAATPPVTSVIAVGPPPPAKLLRRFEKLAVDFVPRDDTFWEHWTRMMRRRLQVSLADSNDPIDDADEPIDAAANVSVPRTGKEPSVSASVSAPAGVPARPAETRGPCRILLVEDDRGIIEIIRRYLRGFAVTIESCDTERDALRLHHNFDAVLCDIHLPDSRGTFIIRAMRDSGYQRPIVAMTGDSSRVTVMECARTRVDHILLKPFVRKELFEMLAHIGLELDCEPAFDVPLK